MLALPLHGELQHWKNRWGEGAVCQTSADFFAPSGLSLDGVTSRAQVMVTDIAATAVACCGIAISALIAVSNVAAGASAIFRRATRTQIMIIDIAATAAALPRIAISPFIVISNVAARRAIPLGGAS